jgi:hypothetical protein
MMSPGSPGSGNGKVLLFKSTPVPQDPSQNDETSFMSSHTPPSSTPPTVVQLCKHSVHQRWVLGANQSGNTCGR